MAAKVMALVITSALLASARGNSEVMQSRDTYSCCNNSTIKFNLHCENTFNHKNEPFAISKDSTTQCASPCKKIEHGLLTLDGCPLLSATEVCTNVAGEVEERRIEYDSTSCSSSAQTPASGGLLLAVLIVGLMMMMMMKETSC